VEADIEKIKKIIEEVKPKYTMFGGNIEFIGVEDGKVKIRPTGFCYR
jgi:Fe-S cluster biogenesis protein NfuA